MCVPSDLFLLTKTVIGVEGKCKCCPSVKHELGQQPFSTTHVIFLIVRTFRGLTCNLAYHFSASSEEGLCGEGEDCHEPNAGQQCSRVWASIQPPARTPAHLPTPGAFSLMAWTGFSLCHDAFIKPVYSPFSTAGHLSHLHSLIVISQASEVLEDMEAVFQ